MKKVIAYGPEILAMEDYFEGKTLILDGFQRFFVLINSTLYCNIKQSNNNWIAVRIYTITDDDEEKFKTLFPESYEKQEVEIDERDTNPVTETAITYCGMAEDEQIPLTESQSVAYTLYENLSISISEIFASQFVLSTHKNLSESKMPLITSYFTNLNEISVKKCRNRVLSKI